MRLVPIALLAACGPWEPSTADVDLAPPTAGIPSVDTDTDTGLDPEPLPACAADFAQLRPEDGAAQVRPEHRIEVRFDRPILATDPWSLGVGGVPGTASLHPDGQGATFHPDGPLAPATPYVLSASVCGQVAQSAFTTLHGPVPIPNVEGRTWAVRYADVVFVTPSLAAMLQPAEWILLQAQGVDPAGGTLSAVAGLGAGAVPAPDCETALHAGAADFSANPILGMGPTDFALGTGPDALAIEDFEVEAVVGPGGDALTELVLLGTLDTRGIVGIGDVCDLSAALGSPCQPCRDGALACLPVLATTPAAEAWPGLDLAGTCGL